MTGCGPASEPSSSGTEARAELRAAPNWAILYATNAPRAPQTGAAGPVTLIIGSDWVGVDRRAPPHSAARAGHARPGRPAAGRQGGSGAIQTRNAGASICSGLPAANPNPGSPP